MDVVNKDNEQITHDKVGIKTSVMCHITKKLVLASEAAQGRSIRPSVLAYIQSKFPDFEENNYVCEEELSRLKSEHIRLLLAHENGRLSDLEKTVAETVAKHDFMSKDFTAEEEETFTFAEKLSDKIAEFGGSWWFICSFFIIMAGWICFNVFALTTKVFDPYPFILLNLVLSCISSIQAPLIMMSQNRSEKKDRNRAINNYMVGLKTEIDVRHLHEKVDRLLQIHIRNQNEMHELQIETMHKLLRRLKALEKKITHTP